MIYIESIPDDYDCTEMIYMILEGTIVEDSQKYAEVELITTRIYFVNTHPKFFLGKINVFGAKRWRKGFSSIEVPGVRWGRECAKLDFNDKRKHTTSLMLSDEKDAMHAFRFAIYRNLRNYLDLNQ